LEEVDDDERVEVEVEVMATTIATISSNSVLHQ
jgi:hypothetical protein